MTHLILPNNEWQPLTFYLATEEVAALRFNEECFFTWVVKPTVIFGRNQMIDNEVSIQFCNDNGIEIVQRKSGGGCVYADEGNIMMSYITPIGNSTTEEIFAKYLNMVASTIGKLEGLAGKIVTTTHNDILLNGKKISGNALYLTPDKRHAIVHGTLLHSTNIERMERAITPSAEKLASKGVASVRQRVMNLSTGIEKTSNRQHLR